MRSSVQLLDASLCLSSRAIHADRCHRGSLLCGCHILATLTVNKHESSQPVVLLLRPTSTKRLTHVEGERIEVNKEAGLSSDNREVLFIIYVIFLAINRRARRSTAAVPPVSAARASTLTRRRPNW